MLKIVKTSSLTIKVKCIVIQMVLQIKKPPQWFESSNRANEHSYQWYQHYNTY